MKLSRVQLAWLLSELIDDLANDDPKSRQRQNKQVKRLDYDRGILGSGAECPPLQTFYYCDVTSVQKCGVEGSQETYDCSDNAVAFQCDNRFERDHKPPFECNTGDFDCADIGFVCLGEFSCPEQGEFQCLGDENTAVFECNNYYEDKVFNCSDEQHHFDCAGENLYDFSCNRGSPTPPPEPFDCPSTDIDPAFICNAEHIFACWTTFHCPRTHFCNPPASTCDETHRWAPADPDDDGSPSDFLCLIFTCDGDTSKPNQRFDCQANSQFKCYDGNGSPTEKFECGANSNFECGEEDEGFVCHSYDCANAFRCTEAFICGDITGALPFECSGTTPETAFSCLAIPMPMPGWLTFDCGAGPSSEHCFKCHDAPGPIQSFHCPAFDCHGMFGP